MLARLASIPRRRPLAFSIAYGGLKTIAADVLVQKYLEGREFLDKRRSCVFLAFGSFQVGFMQYMIYSKLFPYIFTGAGTFSQQSLRQMAQDTQGLKNILKQVSLDMLVYHPCLYFPVFYTCQEVVNGNVDDPRKTVGDAIQKYIPNAVDDWQGLWKIFVPVSFFQNSFCPVHLRVPCVATAGFFYCIVLSMTRGAESTAADTASKMARMSDNEFEGCVATIGNAFRARSEGVGYDEFVVIMGKLGLASVSRQVFEAFDSAEGTHAAGSGVIDAVRLVDGLKLLAGHCSPEDRVKFIVANPEFLLDEVRVRSKMAHISTAEFQDCVESVRNRQWARKAGVDREEFDTIMAELGLAEASSALFDALDEVEGLFPRGSGKIDLVRFTEGMKLLSGQCPPEERIKFLADNPLFLRDAVPGRRGLRRTPSGAYK